MNAVHRLTPTGILPPMITAAIADGVTRQSLNFLDIRGVAA